MTRVSIPRPRLLPATIFVAVLMLTVRLGDLWQDFNRLDLAELSVGQSAALAQDAEAPAVAPAPAPAPAGGEPAGMPPVSASQVGGRRQLGRRASMILRVIPPTLLNRRLIYFRSWLSGVNRSRRARRNSPCERACSRPQRRESTARWRS